VKNLHDLQIHARELSLALRGRGEVTWNEAADVARGLGLDERLALRTVAMGVAIGVLVSDRDFTHVRAKGSGAWAAVRDDDHDDDDS
jgi:hypothetical protein